LGERGAPAGKGTSKLGGYRQPLFVDLCQTACGFGGQKTSTAKARVPWHTAYLEYIYSDEAQDLAGKHFYRLRHEKFVAKYAAKLPKMQLFTQEKAFGSWEKVGKEHFADGGIFDQIDARP
jgi:ABC-type sulfate transport system substrate-binding protein